ncbi:MAG TPA: PQQ-binding-like beta-propeller repeat protein [Verrucomicrobiae bacterium]|nr:PQQ-binding-like beta-propeller repeat protein [Verrucomicrobiae bacterium]
MKRRFLYIVSVGALAFCFATPSSGFTTASGWPPADNSPGKSIQGYQFTSSPAFTSDGRILIGGFDGANQSVFAITTAGAISWKANLDNQPQISVLGQECSPTIGRDGTIYIGAWDHGLYALNPTTGARKGSVYYQPAASQQGPIRTSPVIDRQNRMYVFYDKDESVPGSTVHLTCLQLNSDGTIPSTPVWEWAPALGKMPGNAIASPAIDANGTIYIATRHVDSVREGHVTAIGTSTGSAVVKWEFPDEDADPDVGEVDCIGPVVASPVIGADGTVYIATQSGFEPGSIHLPTIFALDPDSSDADRLKWSFPPPSTINHTQEEVGAFDASPTISADGVMYAVSDAANSIPPMVFAIDTANGSQLWRHTFNRPGGVDASKTGDNSPVMAANGDIFVKLIGINAFGSLLRLNGLDGTIMDEAQIFGDVITFHADFDMPYSQLAVNPSGQVVVATTSVSNIPPSPAPPVGIKLFNSGISGESFWPKWRANNFSTGSVQHNKWTTNSTLLLSISALPTLGGGTYDFAFGINNAGISAGYSEYQSGSTVGYHAVKWSSSGAITELVPFYSSLNSWARAINDNGIIVGGGIQPIGFGTTTAAKWVGTSPPAGLTVQDMIYSEALSINNNNDIVGVYQKTAGIYHGAIWLSGTTSGSDIFSLAGSDPSKNTFAYDVNTLKTFSGGDRGGRVVGKSQRSDGVYHAFRLPLSQGTIFAGTDDLGTLSGIASDYSEARSVNSAGDIVGASTITAAVTNAFRWIQNARGSKFKDLGHLGSVGRYAVATCINDRGQIVGNSTTSAASSTTSAFIIHSGAMVKLYDLLGAGDKFVWSSLNTAESINNNGVIVGYGMYNGHSRAYMIKVL